MNKAQADGIQIGKLCFWLCCLGLRPWTSGDRSYHIQVTQGYSIPCRLRCTLQPMHCTYCHAFFIGSAGPFLSQGPGHGPGNEGRWMEKGLGLSFYPTPWTLGSPGPAYPRKVAGHGRARQGTAGHGLPSKQHSGIQELKSRVETKRSCGLEKCVAKYQDIQLALASTLEGKLPSFSPSSHTHTIKHELAPSTSGEDLTA